MSHHPSSSSWSDFEKAWKSVEELKEELYRTEVKLKQAAKPFSLRNADIDFVHTQSSAKVQSHEFEERRRKKRKVFSRHKRLHSSHDEMASGDAGLQSNYDVSHALHVMPEDIPKHSHRSPSSINSHKLKQKILKSALNRALLKISSDEASSCSGIHLKQDSHLYKNFTKVHAFDQREKATQTLTEISQEKANVPYKELPKVIFSQWEREYLNKEIPGFSVLDVPSNTGETEPKVVEESVSSAFRRSDVMLEGGHATMVKTKKLKTVDGLQKLKEIIEKQRENEYRILTELERRHFPEADTFAKIQKPLSHAEQKARISGSATNATAEPTMADALQYITLIRKVSVAPPPAEYKGFSPVRTQLMDSSPDLKQHSQLSPKLRGSYTISPKMTTRKQAKKISKVKRSISVVDEPEVPQIPVMQQENPSHQIAANEENAVAQEDELHLNGVVIPSSHPPSPEQNASSSGSKREVPDLTESIDKTPSNHEVGEKELSSSDPEDHLKLARKVLEELAASDSDAEYTMGTDILTSTRRKKTNQNTFTAKSVKRKAKTNPEHPSPALKIRHYDREKVKEYMERKRMLRRKKLLEEDEKKMQAQQSKKERLKQLYEYQKMAVNASTKPKPSQTAKSAHQVVKDTNRIYGAEEDEDLVTASLVVEATSSTSKTTGQVANQAPNAKPLKSAAKPFSDDEKQLDVSEAEKTYTPASDFHGTTSRTKQSLITEQKTGPPVTSTTLKSKKIVYPAKSPKRKVRQVLPVRPAVDAQEENHPKPAKQTDLETVKKNELNGHKQLKADSARKSDNNSLPQDVPKTSDEVVSVVQGSASNTSEDDSLSGIPSLDASTEQGIDEKNELLSKQIQPHPTATTKPAESGILPLPVAENVQQLQNHLTLHQFTTKSSQEVADNSDELEEGLLESSPESKVDEDEGSPNVDVHKLDQGKSHIAVLKEMYISTAAQLINEGRQTAGSFAYQPPESEVNVDQNVLARKPVSLRSEDLFQSPPLRESVVERKWRFPLRKIDPDPFNFINTWKRKPLVIHTPAETDIDEMRRDKESNESGDVVENIVEMRESDARTSYTTDFTMSEAQSSGSGMSERHSDSSEKKSKASAASGVSSSSSSANIPAGSGLSEKHPADSAVIIAQRFDNSSDAEIFEGEISDTTLTPLSHRASSRNLASKSMSSVRVLRSKKSERDTESSVSSTVKTLKSAGQTSEQSDALSVDGVRTSDVSSHPHKSLPEPESTQNKGDPETRSISESVPKTGDGKSTSKNNTDQNGFSPEEVMSPSNEASSVHMETDISDSTDSVEDANSVAKALFHSASSGELQEAIEKSSSDGSNGDKNAPKPNSKDEHTENSEVLRKPEDVLEAFPATQESTMLLLDQKIVTEVVAEAAGAAARSAVYATLDNRRLLYHQRRLQQAQQQRNTTPSKNEYTSDFESVPVSHSPSDVSSNRSTSTKVNQKGSLSLMSSIRDQAPDISSIEGSKEELNSGIQESLGNISSASNTTRNGSMKQLPDGTPLEGSQGLLPVKKRSKSGNFSSPSPASLSDNESLTSTTLSSNESSLPYVSEQSGNFGALAPEDSFAQLTLDMVRRMTHEEELRARHQLTLLEFQEKTLVEKARAQMKWLELLKKKLKEKNALDKLPVIQKKQQELVLRLRQERAQLRCMQETYRSVSQKHKTLLAEKKKLLTEPSSLAFQILNKDNSDVALEKSVRKVSTSPSPSIHSVLSVGAEGPSAEEINSANIPEALMSSSSSAVSAKESENTALFQTSHSSYSKHSRSSLNGPGRLPKPESSASHLTQQSSHSLESVLQGLKRLEANKRYLTKREQRLLQRKSHVESLLEWQKKLDHEEKMVKDLELKALDALEKSKSKSKHYVSSSPSSPKNDTTDDRTLTKKSSFITTGGMPSETDVVSSHSMKTGSESKDSDSVPEEEIHSVPEEEIHSVPEEEIHSVVSASSKMEGNLTENASAKSKTPSSENEKLEPETIEEIQENINASQSSIVEEVGSLKLSPMTSFSKSGSSSNPDAYSESFESANDTQNTSGSSVQLKHGSEDDVKKPVSTRASPFFMPRVRRRHDSSGSDDSLTISHSETASDQSDVEGRIHALTEELKRRKVEAEKLRKEHKRRHWEQLKERELSLTKQLEAYDRYIQEASMELAQQLEAAASSDSSNFVSVKPQIKQPHVAKSRHLQKQSSVLTDSKKTDESFDGSSPELKDAPLLSKERKSHSSSQLAKKLRAIETKEVTEEVIKETAQSTSPETLSKESAVSDVSVELGTEQLPPSTPTQLEERSNVDSEPSETLAADSEAAYSSDFVSPEVPSGDNRSSASSSTSVSQNKQSEESVVEDLLEGSPVDSSSSVEAVEKTVVDSSSKLVLVPVVDSNISNDKSLEKDLGESNISIKLSEISFDESDRSSDVIESSFEESDHSNRSHTVHASGYDGSNKSPQDNSQPLSASFESSSSTVEEDVKSESDSCSGSSGCSMKTARKTSLKHPLEHGQRSQEDTSCASSAQCSAEVSEIPVLPQPGRDPPATSITAATVEIGDSKELDEKGRRGVVADGIVDDLLKSVCDDTVSCVYQVVKSSKRTDAESEQPRGVVEDTANSAAKSSLREVQQSAAESVSENVTRTLLEDAVETMLRTYRQRGIQCVLEKADDTSTTTQSDIAADIGRNATVVSPVPSDEFVHETLPDLRSTEEQPEDDASKRDSSSAVQDWFESSLVVSNSSRDDVLPLDAQLLVRQYPYYYRQIPNKPPPPYTPPGASFSSATFAEEQIQKPPEPVDVVQDTICELNGVIEECLTTILEGREQGVPVRDVQPPKEYLDVDHLDLATKSRMIFRRFIFELTRESLLKIYVEKKQRPKPWLRNQKLAPKPVIPTEKNKILSNLKTEIEKALKISARVNEARPSMWSAMKLGCKKRDFVDTIIVGELKEEEAEWINYDEDEFAVKLQLTDSIFDLLIDDTVKVVRELDSLKRPNR